MIQQSTQAVAVPGDLRSPRAKLVYLYLSTHGEATITQLQSGLSMKKITLYSILKTLRKRNLVVETEGRYALQ